MQNKCTTFIYYLGIKFDPATNSLCHDISAQRRRHLLGTHNKTFTINFKFIYVYMYFYLMCFNIFLVFFSCKKKTAADALCR